MPPKSRRAVQSSGFSHTASKAPFLTNSILHRELKNEHIHSGAEGFERISQKNTGDHCVSIMNVSKSTSIHIDRYVYEALTILLQLDIKSPKCYFWPVGTHHFPLLLLSSQRNALNLFADSTEKSLKPLYFFPSITATIFGVQSRSGRKTRLGCGKWNLRRAGILLVPSEWEHLHYPVPLVLVICNANTGKHRLTCSPPADTLPIVSH